MRKIIMILIAGAMTAAAFSGCIGGTEEEVTPIEKQGPPAEIDTRFLARFSYETTGLTLYVNGFPSMFGGVDYNAVDLFWAFGDGTDCEDEDTWYDYYCLHNYESAGEYAVTLTISRDGEVSRHSEIVVVEEGAKNFFIPPPVLENMNNKWAIVGSICTQEYTQFGIESDFMPALRTLIEADPQPS